jgi:hypothetical protein
MVSFLRVHISIRKQEYLKWSVKKNCKTNMWVASIQTKGKGNGRCNTAEMECDTRSYAATSQTEAYETGLALATPKMLSFDQHLICRVCNAKFTVFRRPRHCRNCGVCICSNCSVWWLGIGHGGFFLRGTGHGGTFFSRVVPRVPIGYRNRPSFTQRGLFNI